MYILIFTPPVDYYKYTMCMIDSQNELSHNSWIFATLVDLWY